MNFRPRHLFIRFVLPAVWRFSETQRVRLLQEFSQTELDSAWQSLFALERVKDPELRRHLFSHAIEELHHAELFAKQAAEKSFDPPTVPLTQREPLVALEGGHRKDAVEFMAYLSIGESEIQKDFAVYQKAFPDEGVRSLFKAIYADEELHASQAEAGMEKLARAEGLSPVWLRVRHLGSLTWKRYVSIMTKVGAIPMTFALFIVYVLFAPFCFRQAQRRLAMSPEAQLEILKLQQRRFETEFGAAR